MSFLSARLPIRRFLRRGTFRLLVLDALSSKPMHGYEVGKEISAKFSSVYDPSPGVIYPTLQSLQDEGLVDGRQEEGKTVYTITPQGKAFLSKNLERLQQALKVAKGEPGGDQFPIMRSALKLERTIRICVPEMSKESRMEVSKILDEATERVKTLAAQN